MITEKDLEALGIKNIKEIIFNPSYQRLYEDEVNSKNEGFEEGVDTKTGAVAVRTGIFTGRSPKDKYFVLDDVTKENMCWDHDLKTSPNKAVSYDIWQHCQNLALKQLSNKRLYVVDCFCGTNADTRMKIRFIMEVAWQAHFVKNMFIRPTRQELKNFKPDFVAFNASKTINPNWKEQKLNSENFVIFNLKEKKLVIGGTWYGGEMKKGIFSVMNFYLPLKGIASMHCSANVGEKGDVALFFGLSGTGKTTLSADPKRYLIGDDEHGWDEKGVFNFEGGCYAKTINLSQENEPDIYDAIKRDALLENVTVNKDGSVNYADKSVTENTRVSYPIYHINKIVLPSKAGHANKIIYLSADAFGVLPPVSILDRNQAQYHFLCGYTSKLAGTERGITEPVPSFSPAFGEAFLTLYPTEYAKQLVKKMDEHGAKAYLVNTGWNGTGKRISIKDTRAIIDAIIDGTIEEANTIKIPILNLTVPVELANVSENILDPRDSYKNKIDWENKAKDLAKRYIKYFEQYANTPAGKALIPSGPQI